MAQQPAAPHRHAHPGQRRVDRRVFLAALACAVPVLGGAAIYGAGRRRTAPDFDAQRAFADLRRQCDFGPRVPGAEGHRRCLAFMADELGRLADDVEQQAFTVTAEGNRLELTNLIARFAPPAAGDQRGILLAAHWDTRPRADQDPLLRNRETPIAGANDGASGVAILLELARQYAALRPPTPVTMVFFDGEDYGRTVDNMFLGSIYFAKHLPPRAPRAGILLDMVGDASLSIPREGNSQARARPIVDRVWAKAAELGLAGVFVDRPGPMILDDHIPLLDAGLPTIDVIDFDYPYWHTIADTPDKCAPASLEQVGRVVSAVVYADAL